MTTTTLDGRRDFTDTLVPPARARLHGTAAARPADPLEQMAQADQNDWILLRLVLCTTLSTFVLALATRLQG